VCVSIVVDNLIFVQDFNDLFCSRYCINVSARIAEVGAPTDRALFCL
jgi:hypothetical protein